MGLPRPSRLKAESSAQTPETLTAQEPGGKGPARGSVSTRAWARNGAQWAWRGGRPGTAAGGPKPGPGGPSQEPSPQKSHPHVTDSEGAWPGESVLGRLPVGGPRARCELSSWITSLRSTRPLGELSNGQAAGLGTHSTHGSLSEPEAEARGRKTRPPTQPQPEPPPEAQPRPLHLPWVVTMGSCSRSDPTPRLEQSRHSGRPSGVPRTLETRSHGAGTASSPGPLGRPPAPRQHPPSAAAPYPTCQDGWGLLPSSPAPPSLLSDGDRLRGPGA